MKTDPSHPLYNPEAGDHPLPSDPREIAAVLRATRRSYEDHPYYAARYGARGEAFARSDGGYLAVLVSMPVEHLKEQVFWLAGLLAARGMPRWLMEEQLGLLHEDLCNGAPADAWRYAPLLMAAHALGQERVQHIPQGDQDRLVAEFDTQAGPGLLHAGRMLVSAVCDERAGHSTAVSSLVDWLADPGRFAPRWCDAVAHTVSQARALAGHSQRVSS